MKKYILTIGPALSNEVKLNEIHSDKNIYRINGAHGSIAEIEQNIMRVREQVSDAEILMDLPGNKVRTANITDGIKLEKGNSLRYPVTGLTIRNFTNI